MCVGRHAAENEFFSCHWEGPGSWQESIEGLRRRPNDKRAIFFSQHENATDCGQTQKSTVLGKGLRYSDRG